MTTQLPPLAPSSDANPTNPICQHGVALSLDDKPHCFECEKLATAYGLPGNARMLDYPNALAFTALLKANEATNGTPAPASVFTRPSTDTVGPQAPDAPDVCMCPLCTLRRAVAAEERLGSAALDKVDFIATRTVPTLSDRIAAATAGAADVGVRSRRGLDALMNDLGGQRMLERVVVQLRSEVSEATQDRDAFAQENLELIGKLGVASDAIDALQESEQIANDTVVELQKRLDAQTEATAAQKANYTQMLKLYNDAIGTGNIAELVRERNGLKYSVEELRKDLVTVRAERDTLRVKMQAVTDCVTRFG